MGDEQEGRESEGEESQRRQTLEIVWEGLEDTPTAYANQVLVSHQLGTEFYLFFGELIVTYPLLRASRGGELPEHIVSRPVVKIALTPDVMRQLADAVNEGIERYDKNVRSRRNRKPNQKRDAS